MDKPVKQLTAASLSLKAISCRLGSGGHVQRVGSLLPCGRMTPTQPSMSSSTRPAPAVNRVVHVETKPLEVAQERADNKQHAKTFSPGRSKQHDKGASETTIRQQLQQVDVLENMGISRHFAVEIKRVLDRTYRCWLQRDEEIMLDTATCAMAFRILRMNGYDVSSDELYHVAEASVFQNSLGGYLNDTRTLLELHKASTVGISQDESILDTIGSWSGTLLREQLGSGGALRRTPLIREVEHALDCPFYTTLDRLDHRWTIENFNVTGHHMLETPYLSSRYTSREILALGIRDFSSSQFTYQQELQQLESWVKECRLDQLPFARQKLAYFYLSAAGTMFPPELSDARILWAKNGVLTTVVDDFFDVEDQKKNLKTLSRWLRCGTNITKLSSTRNK